LKHWKSISATLLAASLVTSTAGQAWADETEKVDSSTFDTVNLQEALKNVKDDTVTSEDLKVIASIVPVGYMANNITALSLNLEKISNPRAKEALQKNIDRAIARWEAENKVEEKIEVETPVVVVPPIVELPTTEEEVTPVAVVNEDEVEDENENKDEEKTEAEKEAKKAEIASKKEAKKAEIAAKKEAKKAEITAKKEVKKAEKAAEKEAKKEAKKAEKEERKANKEAKHENKGKKDNE